MNELLSFALWMYLIFLAFIGAISLLLISLAVRDWYKVKRHNIESENNTLKSGSVGDLGKNDVKL